MPTNDKGLRDSEILIDKNGVGGEHHLAEKFCNIL